MKLFLCPLCRYKSRNLSALKIHFRRHEPYCYICNKRFKDLNQLSSHCARNNDEHHLILYYLSRSYKYKCGKSMIRMGIKVSELISIQVQEEQCATQQ